MKAGTKKPRKNPEQGNGTQARRLVKSVSRKVIQDLKVRAA